MNRIKLFRIALAHRDIPMKEFARQNGVTLGLIHNVLKGTTTSKRMSAIIDQFIEAAMNDLRIELAARKAA